MSSKSYILFSVISTLGICLVPYIITGYFLDYACFLSPISMGCFILHALETRSKQGGKNEKENV